MITYVALFSALLSRLTALACSSSWATSFIACFLLLFLLNIHRSGVLTALAWLVPHETAAVSVQVLCTPYNHAPCHFMQGHICKVYACLAVTCHLHFWQNDRDLLRAIAVTQGWNRHRNKSQQRKLTLGKKILPLLQQGFESATFQPLSYPCHLNLLLALTVYTMVDKTHRQTGRPTAVSFQWLVHGQVARSSQPFHLGIFAWNQK